MTICPIAIVAGCKKCPAFKICPLKGVLGDRSSVGDDQCDRLADKVDHTAGQ